MPVLGFIEIKPYDSRSRAGCTTIIRLVLWEGQVVDMC